MSLLEGYVDWTPDDTKTIEPRRIYFNSIKLLKNAFVEASKKRRPGQNLVFTKGDGNPVPKWYIQKLLKKACENAGVGHYRFARSKTHFQHKYDQSRS